LALPDLVCRHRGIGELTQAQRYIYPSFDQIFRRVAEKDIDIEGRVLCQEKGKPWYDVKPRKRERRADAQMSRQGCARTACGDFRFLGFLDDPFRAFVEIRPASLGGELSEDWEGLWTPFAFKEKPRSGRGLRLTE
jgi:hypothetical protein